MGVSRHHHLRRLALAGDQSSPSAEPTSIPFQSVTTASLGRLPLCNPALPPSLVQPSTASISHSPSNPVVTGHPSSSSPQESLVDSLRRDAPDFSGDDEVVILVKNQQKVEIFIKMEGDTLLSGSQIDGKVVETFEKSFVQVQNILDQNRVLINEINQNHESRIPDSLSRNVGLIRELNTNIRKVVHLYAHLSCDFTKSLDHVSSEGDSMSGQKRIRPA